MATATEETKKMVILNLTTEEARTLVTILGHIGGNPNETRRREADSIFNALHHIGYYESFKDTGVKGEIYFTK